MRLSHPPDEYCCIRQRDNAIHRFVENRLLGPVLQLVVSIRKPIVQDTIVPKRVRAEIYRPPNALARRITLLLDGREVASKDIPAAGPYTIESAAPYAGSTVEVRVDRTFRAPGDQRDLGVVLLGVGFAQ